MEVGRFEGQEPEIIDLQLKGVFLPWRISIKKMSEKR